MKYIKYLFEGNEVEMPYNDRNLEIARKEADNGEYTIEDNGLPEPEAPESDAVTWDELAAAIQEGVNSI